MDDSDNSPDNSVTKVIESIFLKLYANDAKTRLSSASQLFEIISKDKEQSLDEVFFYVVERLIKGTKKPKDSAKIGSTVLLTEILQSFTNLRISKLLELSKKIIGDIDDELPVDGVTGWTLIFTSIVQSKRLDISDKKTLKELIRFMVQLGDKKPLSNVAICNLFEMLFDHQFDTEAFSSILKRSLKLNEHGDASPFHLYLILLIHKHPELSRVLDHIPTVDLDDPENLVQYVEATALYYPTIHPACVELFHHIDENNRMEVFWKPIFNDTLFGHGQSYKHHLLGFSFLSAILPRLSESNVDYIFSKQMMDLWMQCCIPKDKDNLHDVAIKLSNDLVENYDNYNASLQAKIISLLTESPGTLSFDEITKTRTVAQLYYETKSEAVDVLVTRIIEKIRDYKAASARDKMRSLYVAQLRDLVKSQHIADSPEIQLNVLNFFLYHGYFDDENSELATPATDTLIERIKFLFFKILSVTCSTNVDILEDVGAYALRLIKGEIPLKDNKSAPLWKKMKKMKIKFKKYKATGDHEKQLSIFRPLLYGIALSSFQDSNDIDALIANFDELVECFKRSLGDDEEENEPKWPNVLLDLMINQFPTQSTFLSCIMIKAFRSIVGDVTLEGLESLKIALLADKLENEEEDEEDEEEDVEDAAVDNQDGENSEKLEGNSEQEESELSEDEEEDDDEDDEEDDVDDEFRAKVTLALGPAAATGDEIEAPIDDDEMLQLDAALSEAFRSKYATNKHTQATLKILRSKCLDLVEIIFKSKEQSLDTIMFLIPVLIDAIKLYGGANETDLRARVAKIFNLLPNFKSFPSYDGVNAKVAQGLFKKGIDMASKMDDKHIQSSAAKICVWIMSLSKHININTDWAFDYLLKLLQEYFSKPNSFVSKEFFMIIFQNHKVFKSQVLEALSKSVFVNLRPFKKIGGLELIRAYLTHCEIDIVKDESIKACLQSIKKDAMTGLMSAIGSKRSALTNEYLCLMVTLIKFIPLDLNKQEIQVIDSIHGPAKAGLSKLAKAARLKILSTADTKVLKQARDNTEEKLNKSLSKKEDAVKQNGLDISTTNDADVENSDDEDVSEAKKKGKKSCEPSPNKRKSDVMEDKLTPKQKKRASLMGSVEKSKSESKKKTREKEPTPAKHLESKNVDLEEKNEDKEIKKSETADEEDEEIYETEVSSTSKPTPSKSISTKSTPIKSTPNKPTPIKSATPRKSIATPQKNSNQEISRADSRPEVKESNTSNTKESTTTPDSSPEILVKDTSRSKGIEHSPKNPDTSAQNIIVSPDKSKTKETLEVPKSSPMKAVKRVASESNDEQNEEDKAEQELKGKTPIKSPAIIKGTPVKSDSVETTPSKPETPSNRKSEKVVIDDSENEQEEEKNYQNGKEDEDEEDEEEKSEKDKEDEEDEDENVEEAKQEKKEKGKGKLVKVEEEEEEEEEEERKEKEANDLQSSKKSNESNQNLNSSLISNRSRKSLDKTPRSSPKPSTSESSKKSKSKTPQPNDKVQEEKIIEKIDENVEKLKSLEISQVNEEPVVKKIKFEIESEKEDEEEEAPTPRLTRSRVQTPRVIKNPIKPEPETKEEQLEADDELADFSVPRVQMIKTPVTRARARSTTPTKEPTTPLRRSLRTRK